MHSSAAMSMHELDPACAAFVLAFQTLRRLDGTLKNILSQPSTINPTSRITPDYKRTHRGG